MRCQVTHSSDVAGGVDRRDHDPQVGGHRGLQGEKRERLLLRVRAHLVDHDVVGDDPFGQLQIAVEQRASGLVHGGRHLAAHVGQGAGEVIELVVEMLAHLDHRFSAILAGWPGSRCGDDRCTRFVTA